jgi:hypothetical protein
MSATGCSSASRPCSRSCSTATLTIALVIEASQNIVSGRTATSPPTSSVPNAPSYSVPSRSPATATNPGAARSLTAR